MNSYKKFAKSRREEEIIIKTINVLKEILKTRKIMLFGSRSKGNFSKFSDFDFAVLRKTPDFKTQMKISEKIESFSGLYNIDIVYMKSIERGFNEIILSTGQIIYEK